MRADAWIVCFPCSRIKENSYKLQDLWKIFIKRGFKYVDIDFHFLGTRAAYLAAQAPRGTLNHNQSINLNNLTLAVFT